MRDTNANREERYAVWLPAKFKEPLHKVAAEQGLSVTAVVTKAIVNYFESYEKGGPVLDPIDRILNSIMVDAPPSSSTGDDT